MGSYGDESYTPRTTSTSRPSTPFFAPTPRPTPTPTPRAPKTSSAAKVRPPVATQITRPKGKINVLMLIDVSSSTRNYIDNLRDKTGYLAEEIVKLIPGLAGKIEFCFMGVSDHCDGNLMLQPTAFSGDPASLKANLENIVNASGGDIPEAYECGFKFLNGQDIKDSNTIVLAVIDSVPHGIGYSEDSGCPDRVDWEKELNELKKKITAFYVISCTEHTSLKILQRKMVDNQKHFIELGTNFTRLTNVIHGIIADHLGEIDKYLDHLTKTRGAARADEVKTLLGK